MLKAGETIFIPKTLDIDVYIDTYETQKYDYRIQKYNYKSHESFLQAGRYYVQNSAGGLVILRRGTINEKGRITSTDPETYSIYGMDQIKILEDNARTSTKDWFPGNPKMGGMTFKAAPVKGSVFRLPKDLAIRALYSKNEKDQYVDVVPMGTYEVLDVVWYEQSPNYAIAPVNVRKKFQGNWPPDEWYYIETPWCVNDLLMSAQRISIREAKAWRP